MEESVIRIMDEKDLRSEEASNLVRDVIEKLQSGKIRVAEKYVGVWKLKKWVIDCINLYFSIRNLHGKDIFGFDAIPADLRREILKMKDVRALEGALVRSGAYVAPGCMIMPSFINIGAYVDEHTMIDTWATIGSGAQIGKRCHISGGVGIGGILEPKQNMPVIVEDDCFIGSRCVIAEGVHIGQEAVIGAGVILTSSTKIFDVNKDIKIPEYGHIPPRSVVIMGSVEKDFSGGRFSVPCALILGERDQDTDKKVSLNNALRKYDITK